MYNIYTLGQIIASYLATSQTELIQDENLDTKHQLFLLNFIVCMSTFLCEYILYSDFTLYNNIL